MKWFLAVAVLTITIVSVAFGQGETVSNKPNGKLEQALMRIEHEINSGVVKGDTSALEKYFADISLFTDPGGMVMDKAQTIADFKSESKDGILKG